MSLWLQRYEEKRGEGAKVIRFSECLARLAAQLRSEVEKTGKFRSKAPHFLHTAPRFLRFAPVSFRAAEGRRRRFGKGTRRDGTLHAEARIEGLSQHKKPRLRRGEDGESGRKTTEWGRSKSFVAVFDVFEAAFAHDLELHFMVLVTLPS